MSTYLDQAKRVVIKIGSALLIEPTSGAAHTDWLAALGDDIAALKSAGKDVLIVSSGAIALGRKKLGLPQGELRLEQSQAAAAAGQLDLVNAYQQVLTPHGHKTAQILLTLGDTEERRRYLNARHTIDTLLEVGAIPVVNENDTVATNEIRFGDNDRLAARVASMISADCLILLSDVAGLYSADPRRHADAEFISLVKHITPEIEAMAGKAPATTANNVGSGGMITKLAAAKIANGAGCHMAITDGTKTNPITNLHQGGTATWFAAQKTPRQSRKQWIAATLAPHGTITIDAGALRALEQGKSLLPAGITNVVGSFERGDAVIVQDDSGNEIARGLVSYGGDDARQIVGVNSSKIEGILGFSGRPELIHRDDLVMTNAALKKTES